MPRLKLTKGAIDALPIPAKDVVYWDSGCPGFGVKVTPKGRKVFIALYRAGGAGSRLRKYTIGPYGRVTLHQARAAAQKVFAARLGGRDPAAEKQQARRRLEQPASHRTQVALVMEVSGRGAPGALHALATPHLASALLQHRDASVTEEHYNRASSISVAGQYADLVRGLRSDADRRWTQDFYCSGTLPGGQ